MAGYTGRRENGENPRSCHRTWKLRFVRLVGGRESEGGEGRVELSTVGECKVRRDGVDGEERGVGWGDVGG